MSVQTDLAKISVVQFAERFRDEMIPLSNTFSYFCAALPLTEDDIKEYLREPIAALPPAISVVLPPVSILLVPYVEKGKEKRGSNGAPKEDLISIEQPPLNRQSLASRSVTEKGATLVFALKSQDLGEYHYRFYHAIANLIGDQWSQDVQDKYTEVLREELIAKVHGEVDEESWRLKLALQRQKSLRRDTKPFRAYTRQSFVDTLTLYLHGICCDIDVEPGPKQLPSRYVRKRLELLHSLYPPPEGYAVFPEDLHNRKK